MTVTATHANQGFHASVQSALQRIGTGTSVVRVPRGKLLYAAGSRGSNVYLVLDGYVKTTTVSISGKQCLLSIHSPGDLVGESCLLNSEHYESATAMTPATLRRIPQSSLFKALDDQDLYGDFLRLLTRRLCEQQQFITHLVTDNCEQRLAFALLRLARKIGVQQPGGRVVMTQRLTQEELAGMVGTTRSRVGFFLKNFRMRGMLEPGPGSLMTVNVPELVKFLNTRD